MNFSNASAGSEHKAGASVSPLRPPVGRPRFDVLAFGCVSVDDILYVDRYPAPDDKEEVLASERHPGGLSGTALVAAARYGAKTSYAGVLGEKALSQYVIAALEAEGVSTHNARRLPGARPIHSHIIVGSKSATRNVYFDLTGVTPRAAAEIDDEFVTRTRVLFIDHQGPEATIRAAQLARHHGIPVVADFENAKVERIDELLAAPDHLVLSYRFAQQITKTTTAKEAANALWNAQRTAVVITQGKDGSWCRSATTPDARHVPALAVDALDTTGCGDVFHGVYAAALAEGRGSFDCVRRASVAAGLKATTHGGQVGIPRRGELDAALPKLGES